MTLSLEDFDLKVGAHIHKKDTLLETIKTEPYYRPIQIFLNGNIRAAVSAKPDDIRATKAYLDKNPRPVFVHAPYCINLCKPPGSEEDYFVKSTQDCLKIAVAAGFRGVVIHTGKCVKGSQHQLTHMKTNVISCLEHATESCPLLIETPAGQGTEQLQTPNELVSFVNDINDQRLGICLDSCHVFSQGYDPIDYWYKVSELGGLSKLKLIHYNDCSVEKGACRDLHAAIGHGKIPVSSLLQIAALAINLEIPLIRE